MSTGYLRTVQQESEILRRRIKWRTDDPSSLVTAAVTQERFVEMQELLETSIYVDDMILDYVSQIVRATREHPVVEVGASPRGALALLKLSRALAAMSGRDFVTPDDVKTFAPEALAHRIVLKMEHALDGKVTPQKVVESVLFKVEVPTIPHKE
jgi:MoxR-like ATPase